MGPAGRLCLADLKLKGDPTARGLRASFSAQAMPTYLGRSERREGGRAHCTAAFDPGTMSLSITNNLLPSDDGVRH